MMDAIKNKRISERYNRILEQGETEKKESSKAFKAELEKTHNISKQKAKSVFQSRMPKEMTPLRIARSKNITLNQAIKLAKYGPIIQEMAIKYNVPIELISGVILQESNANMMAKSHAGAKGLMQLMPSTAKRFGVTDIFDPKQNIEGGTKYLRFLLDRFNGDLKLALAGYNAGEHRVEQGTGDLDAVVVEDGEVVFEVVADLFGGAAERCAQMGDGGWQIGDREVPGFVGLPGEGDA